jgi:hypothetical protein
MWVAYPINENKRLKKKNKHLKIWINLFISSFI